MWLRKTVFNVLLTVEDPAGGYLFGMEIWKALIANFPSLFCKLQSNIQKEIYTAKEISPDRLNNRVRLGSRGRLGNRVTRLDQVAEVDRVNKIDEYTG